MLIYEDRAQAGRALGRALSGPRARWSEPLRVLGLPRGGVPVAVEVTRALDAPLDVLVVRKVGAPGNREFALGAIAQGGVVVRDLAVGGAGGCSPEAFEAQLERERVELQRREQSFRDGRPPLDLRGTVAVLVDDGLATGATMLAAVRAARQAGAARVVVAVPVASREAYQRVSAEADEVIALEVPRCFMAVGEWYQDFRQVEDAEVRRLLRSEPGS
jgi:predicted phosphoribosyltransferase